ncbi:UNVERIFIED_CONTAM: hypothetical protein FKN15_055651 [Acipenser sinensis]
MFGTSWEVSHIDWDCPAMGCDLIQLEEGDEGFRSKGSRALIRAAEKEEEEEVCHHLKDILSFIEGVKLGDTDTVAPQEELT